MSYRFLEPGVIAIHDDRWFVPPWGVNGGKPGARARKILEKPDGSQTIVGNKVEDVAVAAGDVLHFVTWGGGGWGDPFDRDAALVAKEVSQGLVTREGARAYGVVLTDEGGVDEGATGALRDTMRSERGEAPLFDYGPDLDTLRANCEADTGLPAPIQPEWAAYQIAAE
jgi:N-methylhydantoinase B